MKRTTGSSVLEREPRSHEASPKHHATGGVARRRRVVAERPVPHAKADPGPGLYRTILACSLDDDKA